ncbi:transmembrane 9 superfamily member 2-like [Quercus robur]|uniref:transmembrane 9 superfamily member 2-like n=1 Tax=Quercus robur TaxID=38942 RepID=UPI002163484D|nr:transmembrane 9 superfamily member 2-like [Quercus robur]
MARRVRTPLNFFVLILIVLPTLVFAIRTLRNAPLSEEDRQYNEGDYIPLFANKVYSNQEDSCEEYSYFDLPFCSPGGILLEM